MRAGEFFLGVALAGLAVALGRRLQGSIPVGGNVVTQVKIMPILNVSGCPLESRLPSVEGWPFEDDAAIWRQPNRSLVEAVELLGGKLDRPETVTVDAQGNVYFMEQGAGRISWAPGGDLSKHELFATTGGSPLGGVVSEAGDLIFADAAKGLMMVEHGPKRVVRFLTDRVSLSSPLDPGTTVAFPDGVTVTRDGTVYFSDAASLPPQRYPSKGDRFEVVEAVTDAVLMGPTGRLLRYSPLLGETTVLMTGLWFANGVALSYDETFVLVAGSIENRVHRYWLQGPKRGTHEVFAVLPGVPDGIALAPDGGFWLALFAELPPLATYACTRLEGSVIPLRAILARLPRALLPRIRPVGMVAKLSSEGKVLRFLLDEDGSTVRTCTSAVEHAGKLYLGNVDSTAAAVLSLR